jgi:hypothetical protein
MQGMENKNRFNLEQALQGFTENCASRPGISPEDARELECDLRERMADLLKTGLREEEAFWRAAREMGSPGELAREFAKENPLALWRERLFWMVWAGFAVSVWGFLTNGALLWLYRELLLHLTWATWITLTGQVPVLLAAVVLAKGKLEQRSSLPEWCLRTRARVAVTAGGAFLVAAVVRLFGPLPMQLPAAGLPTNALFLLDFFGWPFVLLLLGVMLFRPRELDKKSSSRFAGRPTPASVWHERVFWMALAGLVVGLWQSTTAFGITALFYTGNNEHPYDTAPLVLMAVQKLILLSPLIIAGLLYRRQMRAGQGFGTGTLDRNRVSMALPAVLCAWVALHAWSSYVWMPRGLAFPWRGFWVSYVTNLQWLWPVSLAALVFWLAPQRPEADEGIAHRAIEPGPAA